MVVTLLGMKKRTGMQKRREITCGDILYGDKTYGNVTYGDVPPLYPPKHLINQLTLLNVVFQISVADFFVMTLGWGGGEAVVFYCWVEAVIGSVNSFGLFVLEEKNYLLL